jgi:hypothetical protein
MIQCQSKWSYRPQDGINCATIEDDKNGVMVAAIPRRSGLRLALSDEQGRLIAAAPDLLAVLQAIEEYEDSEPAPGTREAEITALRRAAIAKATSQ